MKKYFIIVMFAAMAMTTSFLTACSSDENESNNNETTGVTEFSASVEQMTVTDAKGFLLNEGTRTSLDTAYQFYWENGDKIYVKKSGSWKASSTLNLTERQTFSKFIVNETFTASESSVDVLYVGQNGTASGASASVTIAAAQNQKSWNVATHIGTSGDCGTATATRDDLTGKYTFTLQHQASYLIFYPYLDSSLDGYKLTSIDIESENGTQLAGRFGFSMSGLATTATSGGTNKISLTLGNNGAGLPLQNTQPITKADGTHCYAVIHPGNHKLKVTYHVVNASDATDKFDVEQSLAVGGNARTFNPNGVSIITFKLAYPIYPTNDSFILEDTYYLWDAKKWVWDGSNTYPTSSDADRWCTTGYNAAAVNPSALSMPTYAALTWYVAGGAYWDETTSWTFYGLTKTGGFWLKCWEHLPLTGGAVGTTPTTCATASGITYINSYSNDTNVRRITIGKPSQSEIDAGVWFFLPALGNYPDRFSYDIMQPTELGERCYYWSSSSNGARSYYLWGGYVALGEHYAKKELQISDKARYDALVANQRPEWHTNRSWFQ